MRLASIHSRHDWLLEHPKESVGDSTSSLFMSSDNSTKQGSISIKYSSNSINHTDKLLPATCKATQTQQQETTSDIA